MSRYRTTIRPAGGGGIPAGVVWWYVEQPANSEWSNRASWNMPHSRPLTPQELAHFDIVEVP